MSFTECKYMFDSNYSIKRYEYDYRKKNNNCILYYDNFEDFNITPVSYPEITQSKNNSKQFNKQNFYNHNCSKNDVDTCEDFYNCRIEDGICKDIFDLNNINNNEKKFIYYSDIKNMPTFTQEKFKYIFSEYKGQYKDDKRYDISYKDTNKLSDIYNEEIKKTKNKDCKGLFTEDEKYSFDYFKNNRINPKSIFGRIEHFDDLFYSNEYTRPTDTMAPGDLEEMDLVINLNNEDCEEMKKTEYEVWKEGSCLFNEDVLKVTRAHMESDDDFYRRVMYAKKYHSEEYQKFIVLKNKIKEDRRKKYLKMHEEESIIHYSWLKSKEYNTPWKERPGTCTTNIKENNQVECSSNQCEELECKNIFK